MSPLVTSSSSSPLSVTSLTALSIDSHATSSRASLTSRSLVIAASATSEPNTGQTPSDRDGDDKHGTTDTSRVTSGDVSQEETTAEVNEAAPAASTESVRGETAHGAPEITREDSCGPQKTLLQLVSDGDDLTVNGDDAMGATRDAGQRSSVNDESKTVTAAAAAADECKPQQRSAQQAPAPAAANGDDSGSQRTSSELAAVQAAAKAGEVITGSNSTAVSRSNSSESTTAISKQPASSHSSCLKADVNDEHTAPESATTWSDNKDAERDKTDTSHVASGDVSQETNEAASGATVDGGDDESGASQTEPGTTAGDVEPVEDVTKTSLKEQQLRQVMTLPAALLSHVNPSLPISLTLNHHQQMTVPASNIYQSKCGLRLLLPVDSLPVGYVDSRQQLMCTLQPRSDDDASQLQQISVSLTLY